MSDKTDFIATNLDKMEDYCKKENIFYTEKDRVTNMISQSKGQYKNFRGHFNKAFSHIKEIPDHPNLHVLLTGTEDDFLPANMAELANK